MLQLRITQTKPVRLVFQSGLANQDCKSFQKKFLQQNHFALAHFPCLNVNVLNVLYFLLRTMTSGTTTSSKILGLRITVLPFKYENTGENLMGYISANILKGDSSSKSKILRYTSYFISKSLPSDSRRLNALYPLPIGKRCLANFHYSSHNITLQSQIKDRRAQTPF